MESPVPRRVARRVWEGGCRLRATRKGGLRAVPLPHQHQGFIPTEMWRDELAGEQVEAHKAEDDDEIGQEAAPWFVPVPASTLRR